MNLLRLVCLLSVCCLLGSARELPSIPAQHPEQIGGRWETVTPSGIEGLGFEIVSSSKGPLGSEGERFIWQAVNVRVYTREGGKEKWGYFAAQYRLKPETDPLPDPTSFEVFDGRHLRIHFTDTTDVKPFDLDIVFSPRANKWIGTWSRNGKDERVTLRRPEANRGAEPNKFVGEWIGEPSSDPKHPFEPTTLNVRQSADGVVSAWLDRTSSGAGYMSGVIKNERRNGEQLNVESISDSRIVLKTNYPMGVPSEFRGAISADGQTLTGKWGTPGECCGTLSAASQFHRAQTTPQPSGR